MPEPIRILEMEASKGWGGQEKRTVRLVNHLNPDLFQVFYAVQPDSKLLTLQDQIRATLIPVRMRQSYDIKALLTLCKLIRLHRIDVIVTHSGKDGWLGAFAGKLTGTPVVRMRHLQTPISSPLSYNLSTRVVAVSKLVEEDLVRRGVRKEKLSTIYTGIDTERFRPDTVSPLRSMIGVPDDAVLIGIVAVLRNAKRHIDLFTAMPRLPENAHLVVVGEGPQWEKLNRLVDEQNLRGRVHFLGHREDIDKLLPGLDIFCLPSNMEALGTALLEAAACGVPCVASRVGGIPECVREGENGLLFSAENVDELAAALERLCKDSSLRKSMGERGRRLAEEEFSVTAMTRNSENLYSTLAGQSK